MHADIDDESRTPPIDILSYWQSCFWRNFFHELPIDLNTFPVPYKEIKKDCLKGALVSEENGLYWLASYVQIEKAAWPLIWIPVQILQNKLILRKEHLALPWIPNTLFLPSSAFYLETKALYDDFLKFDCIENGRYCFKNFSQFYQTCLDLVIQMMSHSTKTHFDISQANFILVKESDLYALGQEKISVNRLVNQYTRGFEHRSREILSEKNFLNFLHRQFVDNTKDTFDESFHLALLSLLNLKSGDLQAVTTPIGSMKIELIQAYAENLYCLHALDKKEKPRIALLLQTEHQERFQIYPSIDKDRLLSQCRKILNTPKINELGGVCGVIRQHMLKQYDIILKTIRLARNLSILREKNIAVYEDVYLLFKETQQEQIQLEKQHSTYVAIYKKWQDKLTSHSVLQKCVGWLSFVKHLRRKKAQDFLSKALAEVSLDFSSEQSLLEAIQTTEDAQQENAQQQAQIVEFLNQLRSAETTWAEWVNKLNVFYDPQDLSVIGLNKLLKTPRVHMRQLTCLYWQAHHLIEGADGQSKIGTQIAKISDTKLLNVNLLETKEDEYYSLKDDIAIEYLLINGAEQQTASSVLPLLAKAHNAVFFGDKLAAIHAPLLSASEDEFILKQTYKQNEEEIEMLQILGAALSYANAFVLALNQSRHHSALSVRMSSQEGIKLKCIKKKQQRLFNYWNKNYHQSTLVIMDSKKVSSVQPSIHFVDVKNQETGHVNKPEAEVILASLQANPGLQTHCVIVTPFYEQQQLLMKMLSGFSVEIYHFLELPVREYNTIIFSPVYSAHSKRPFLFDEGKGYFYNLISRAKQNFWIIGDREIFQTHLHSASGDIAKWFNQEGNRVDRIEAVEMA